MFKKFLSILFLFNILILFNANATQNISTTNNIMQQNNNDVIIQKNNVNIIQKQQSKNGEPLPENVLYIELKDGVVIAELFPSLAPMHVQRIKILTKDGFYDNVKFHRVIKGFMAQTGDPTGTGRGGSRLGKLYAEFNKEHHVRGTLSMARASDPNSANSQFFIVTGDFFPELDGQYTIFGRVLDGMEYVDKIKPGNTENNGIVENPDEMIKVVTGDMLNNKSITQIKEEIRIINKVQEERLRDNPTYQKKSVIDLLVQTKDVIPNVDTKDSTNILNNNVQNNVNNTSNLQNNINAVPTNNNIQQDTNTQPINNNVNNVMPTNIEQNNNIQNTNANQIQNNTDYEPVEVIPQSPTINNNTTLPTQQTNNTPQLPTTNNSVPAMPINNNTQPLTNNTTQDSIPMPELPETFDIPQVPDIPELNNSNSDTNNTQNTEQTNDPFAGLDTMGLDLPSPYQP